MKIIPTVFASLALICLSHAAYAKCATRAEFVEKLKNDFNEYVSLVGVRDGGQSIIEFFVSDTGTWTVLESYADGRACSRAYGKSWVRVPKQEPGA